MGQSTDVRPLSAGAPCKRHLLVRSEAENRDRVNSCDGQRQCADRKRGYQHTIETARRFHHRNFIVHGSIIEGEQRIDGGDGCAQRVNELFGGLRRPDCRHHSTDPIGLAVEDDGGADDVRIAVITVQPQGVADHGERLMSPLPACKDAAKNGLNAQGGDDPCCEAGAWTIPGSHCREKFVVLVHSRQGRETRLSGQSNRLRPHGQSQRDSNRLPGVDLPTSQAVGVDEWERTQKYAIDERKDRSRSSDAERLSVSTTVKVKPGSLRSCFACSTPPYARLAATRASSSEMPCCLKSSSRSAR